MNEVTIDEPSVDARNSKSIQIRLSKSGRKKTFSSPEQLSAFINEQRFSFNFTEEQWKSTHESLVGDYIWNNFYTPVLEQMKSIKTAWEYNHDHLDSLIESFEVNYFEFYIPLSNSALGQFIIKHSKTSPIEAILISFASITPDLTPLKNPNKVMYTHYINLIGAKRNGDNDSNCQSFKTLNGYYLKAQRLLTAFELSANKAAIQSHIDHLDSVVKDTTELYDQSVKDKQNFDVWLKNEQASLETLKDEKTKKYQLDFSNSIKKIIKAKRAITRRVDTDVQSSLDRLEQAEITYKSKIELSASVAYWETKKVTHKTELKTWLIALILFSLSTVIFPPLLGYLVAGWTQELFTDKLLFGAINPLALTTTVILLSLCTYAIRFSSRQYSSAKHLMLEAVERKTMISTYLALMNEDKLKEQEDRKIALDTLFRPSSTGIVADNAAIMPTDAVIKVLDKRAN
ncbi:hypothetical protein FLM48_10200 [Shewanella sp. Scap07]|uniref:DUF6161 domain-containing protein n=1 Tax=Shewanella sp. Scap07 TaxID=2589987 RepID=UPI0015B80D4D|nr:DUF6161 domain-containing protein [Shewanella sp. Scap07]QLE85416.1 hypothetical protein FLM48_10200 [Shewanella sp. Scap07]